VSQKVYDEVVQARDEYHDQTIFLQADLDEISTCQSDARVIVDRLDTELNALTVFNSFIMEVAQFASAEYTVTDSGLQTTTSSDLIAVSRAAMVFITDFEKAIDDIDNEQLTQEWEELITASAIQDEELVQDKLVSVLDVLNSLITDDMKALEAVLNEYSM
jgi:hypothetical protein